MSDTVLVALIAGCTSIIVVALGILDRRSAKRTEALEVKVDGRLTQLLEAAAALGVSNTALGRAEGVAEGMATERDRS